MRKRAATVVLLAALTSAPSAFAQSSHAQQIAEANALTDAGKFDDAIAKLQQVLTDDPADKTARYELGLAYGDKGDTKQCLATLEPIGNAAGPMQVAALTMIANCLDTAHDGKAAIATYRRALAIDRNDPEVAFNLGIALARNGGPYDEARELLKKHAIADPDHASGHYALAKVFEGMNFPIPALFSYLHFLALEPTGSRAADAAARVRLLMDAGVQKTAKGANITIDPTASTAEGDYSAMAMILPITAASRGFKEKAKLSEFEQIREQLKTDVLLLSEAGKQTDYTATVNARFFEEMKKAKALDGFAAAALLTQKLPGTQEWSVAHEAEVNAFLEWRRSHVRAAGVMMPAAPVPAAPAPAPAPTPAP